MNKHQATSADLHRRAGVTYASEAQISLRNTPMPLFQLLVLSQLLSARISANTAVAAARELFGAGLRNHSAVLDAPRRRIIAALGAAGYARYDESTATRLVEVSQLLSTRYGGDLRELAEASQGNTDTARRLLQEFKGIGPVGADIFLREVQGVWPWVAPYFDKKSLQSAAELGLPTDPSQLAELAPDGPAAFAAALIRASLDKRLRASIGS
jgi:endonuclease III